MSSNDACFQRGKPIPNNQWGNLGGKRDGARGGGGLRYEVQSAIPVIRTGILRGKKKSVTSMETGSKRRGKKKKTARSA